MVLKKANTAITNLNLKLSFVSIQLSPNLSDQDWRCDIIDLFLIENNLPILSLEYIRLETKMMKVSLGFDG